MTFTVSVSQHPAATNLMEIPVIRYSTEYGDRELLAFGNDQQCCNNALSIQHQGHCQDILHLASLEGSSMLPTWNWKSRFFIKACALLLGVFQHRNTVMDFKNIKNACRIMQTAKRFFCCGGNSKFWRAPVSHQICRAIVNLWTSLQPFNFGFLRLSCHRPSLLNALITELLMMVLARIDCFSICSARRAGHQLIIPRNKAAVCVLWCLGSLLCSCVHILSELAESAYPVSNYTTTYHFKASRMLRESTF